VSLSNGVVHRPGSDPEVRVAATAGEAVDWAMARARGESEGVPS
jgi:hypothetical protein